MDFGTYIGMSNSVLFCVTRYLLRYYFSVKFNSCIVLNDDCKSILMTVFLVFFGLTLFTRSEPVRRPQKKPELRYRTPNKIRPPLFDYVYKR